MAGEFSASRHGPGSDAPDWTERWINRHGASPNSGEGRAVDESQIPRVDSIRLPRDRARPLRVRMVGNWLASAAPGGGETQIDGLAAALASLDVDARPWRPWEDAWSEIDCLHLVGSVPEHLPLVAMARRLGVPVALSTVAWFDFSSRWHAGATWSESLRGCLGLAIRRALPRLPNWRRRLYHAVDLLLPNSNAEAEQLQQWFNISPRRIHCVPNGADERFAEGNERAFASLIDQSRAPRNFVLYAGRIEPRKNQLGFLRAMRHSGVPIVVLGDAVPGHERYLDECRRVAGPEVTFVGRVPHDDPLLASAYAACGCLALVSWFETPGLVALEAGMSGVPLVLTDRGSAAEYFGLLATYVPPDDHAMIRSAVCRALAQGRDEKLATLVRNCFTWRNAALATKEAYERLR